MGKSTRISNGCLSAAEDPRISVQMQVIRELKRPEEDTPISPRSLRWVNDLFPLLETYNFSSVEIVSLVKRCEYNSEQIQIAVSAILEQALGHEQGEWKQVKNRKQKKEEQIVKERVKDLQERNMRHIPGYGVANGLRENRRRYRGGGRGGGIRGGRGGFTGSRSSSNGINRVNLGFTPTSSSNIIEEEEAAGDDTTISSELQKNANNAIPHSVSTTNKSTDDRENANLSNASDVKRYVNSRQNKQVLSSTLKKSSLKQSSDIKSAGESYTHGTALSHTSIENSSNSWAARLMSSKTSYRAVASQQKPVTVVDENSANVSEPSSTITNINEIVNVSEVNAVSPLDCQSSQLSKISQESPAIESSRPVIPQAELCVIKHSTPLKKPVTESVILSDFSGSVSEVQTPVNILEPEEPVVMPMHHVVDEVSKKGLMFGTVTFDGDAAANDRSASDFGDEGTPVKAVHVPSYSTHDGNLMANVIKISSQQDQRSYNATFTTADRTTVNQQTQPSNIRSGRESSVSASKVYSRSNPSNNSVKYIGQKTQVASDIEISSTVNDCIVSSTTYSRQDDAQKMPADCLNQQQEPLVEAIGTFQSKQLLSSSTSPPASTSANACVQTYVAMPQQRKGSEAGSGSQATNSRSSTSLNSYSRGVAAQNYCGQSSTASTAGRGVGVNNANTNFSSQRQYSGNSIQQQQEQQNYPHQTQSPYQHSRGTPLNDKAHSFHSSWYDQQQNQQQPTRTNQAIETSSNTQYSRNVSTTAPVPQQTPSQSASTTSQQTGNYNRPPPPLPTADAQSQTLLQQTSSKNPGGGSNKSGHSVTVGQPQQGSQPQQHAANVYGGHPYSSAPPGLTPSGPPAGMHTQAAFNYGYPNMGYPPYNLPAYSGGYGQPMIPQYGMMGAPFNDKGGPGMHGGYPNQYGMSYGESFDDPSSLQYSNANNGNPNDILGYETLGNNHFHGSGQQSTQGASSSPGSSSSSNSASHAQGGSQMQNFNTSGSPSTNAVGNSNYGNNGAYGQSYNSSTSGFSSTGQNAPPGFGSGYNQKDGRASCTAINGLGGNSSIQNNNGYFPSANNQNNSNAGNGGPVMSSGSRSSNNNIANNINTWDNHCTNQSQSQNQYSPSSACGNQGGSSGGGSGYGGVPYSNRGGKTINYSYSSNSGVSGQYSNCNYGNRSSVGGNGQNNDASQGYYSYGYNQPSSNMQGQYSSQNPPGLGGNYYTGQQFQQHSGGHYNNRNGQGYGGYNNASVWNNS